MIVKLLDNYKFEHEIKQRIFNNHLRGRFCEVKDDYISPLKSREDFYLSWLSNFEIQFDKPYDKIQIDDINDKIYNILATLDQTSSINNKEIEQGFLIGLWNENLDIINNTYGLDKFHCLDYKDPLYIYNYIKLFIERLLEINKEEDFVPILELLLEHLDMYVETEHLYPYNDKEYYKVGYWLDTIDQDETQKIYDKSRYLKHNEVLDNFDISKDEMKFAATFIATLLYNYVPHPVNNKSFLEALLFYKDGYSKVLDSFLGVIEDFNYSINNYHKKCGCKNPIYRSELFPNEIEEVFMSTIQAALVEQLKCTDYWLLNVPKVVMSKIISLLEACLENGYILGHLNHIITKEFIENLKLIRDNGDWHKDLNKIEMNFGRFFSEIFPHLNVQEEN